MTLSRREFLNAGIAGTLVTGSGAAPSVASRAARKPNILLLMADQSRADCLGVEGHPVVRTPNLDHVASEGARFRCAYSAVPSCTPARSALLTGLGPWRNGMLGYGRMAETYGNEMPRMLRDAGYYGVGIGDLARRPESTLYSPHFPGRS